MNMSIKISQEQIMNEVRTINTTYSQSEKKQAVFEGEEQEVMFYTKKKCTMFFPAGKASEIKISSQSFKILDYLLMGLQIKRNMNINDIIGLRKVKKPISEWCELFNIQYQTENIKMLESHLTSLILPVITYRGHTVVRDEQGNVVFTKGNRIKESSRSLLFFHILDDVRITDGYIEVYINESFLELLADYSYDMLYSPKIFSLNVNNNPNAYNFSYRLQEHYKMNCRKANANIISVESLLSCTDIIPDKEKLPRSNSFVEKIVKPFERDLNALVDNKIIKSWNYINDEGEYLGKVNAKNFYELKIHFLFDDM